MGERPFTKRQTDAMLSAITGAWLELADLGLRAEAFRAGLPARRLDLVLAGLAERIVWHERHAASDRATAEHFRAPPGIYGDATPEMIERFTAGAAKYDKGAAWFRALLERVAREGLPPVVAEFDPTAR
jgi:hypothetical protein